MAVNLKRLLKKEVCSIISEFDKDAFVMDVKDKILYGDSGQNPGKAPGQGSGCRQPVRLGADLLGWVGGGNKSALVASLLAYLAVLEAEKKSLARETLDKYREISLLYSLTEKFSKNLDSEEIAMSVLDEVKKIIKGDSIYILTINEETGQLEILVGVGPENCLSLGMKPGEGIAGDIIRTGKAEIVNDVMQDPRFIPGEVPVSSLMCAPLIIKDQVIGVMSVSSEKSVIYKAEDLKILSALAFQAAFILENTKLNFIRETFGRYLSDDLVSKLLATPGALKLGGEKKEITIMMSDLRGFTSLTEQLPPETVVAIINNYLKCMVDVIQNYNGTILEFIGDAIMTIFGAPLWTSDHAVQAVACALEMQLAMEEVNRWNQDNNYPEIQMGIGINTGHVVVGNIGSEKRTKYGCVGSQVNTTSRIESYSLGGQVLISRETLQALGDIRPELSEEFEASPKGIKEPIKIFSLSGLGDPYNLFLKQGGHEVIQLAEAVQVRVFLITDKHCSDKSFEGKISKVSRDGLEISGDVYLPAMTNLKLQILDPQGLTIIDEIYGKTKYEKKSKEKVLVNLTSLPEEGRIYLGKLLVKAESCRHDQK
ncbi:family 3 adenylate cyclase [Desulfosporosinus orientis DSM 765]|uniref:Family 3 adenylate cyclase n=1 Tax=Desulfosporosinus orientis (strain ATCC 19365 / DSM 765 / NCIMB 8382 / VKM B-1628 / Singapore I) TaxID=768706 RepID=G7W6R7_DESOD|nr:adenylate/guanylate cyclase domain-containing protein [Desulfosporosinus orientis]AET69199.1 family 3 adenylate cyclase [Desulfosporosinus orientis DSM 765]